MADNIIVRIPLEIYYSEGDTTEKRLYVVELKHISAVSTEPIIGTITESIDDFEPTVYNLVPQMV